MKGTEKQISWATDITNRVISVLEQAAADISNLPGDESIKAANIAGLNQRIDALRSADEASDVINIFRFVKLTGNQDHDFREVLAQYRVHRPETDGERKILCK